MKPWLSTALLTALWLAAACATSPAQAESPARSDAQALRFVACPVYRDTDSGRKSGCWLATQAETGRRFDLQQSLTKPQLGRAVLVEGVLPPSDQQQDRECGGVVLEKLQVSVLPEVCASAVLPAEGFPGKRFELPATVMTPNHLPQPQPALPWATRRFVIRFDHNDDYLLYQHAEVVLQDVVRLARLGGAVRIVIEGHAATQAATVSGRVLQEGPKLAERRARMVQEAVLRLGWPRSRTVTRWSDNPPPTPGTEPALAEASKRRVDVLVEVVEPKPSADVAADAPLGSGPYPAVMQTVAALPDHTLYRPRELPAAGSPALPVLLWANGACLNVGNRFRWFLSEVASHGFLVIALGRVGPAEVESNPASTYRGEPAADSPAAKEAEGPRPAAWRPGQASTTPGQLLMGLDWAQQAQHEAGGPWQGRIDSSRVAVMGQSCGGLQALAVAGDPRIRTVGVWNSGGLTDEGMAARIAGAPVTKEQITALRVPALYVTGDMGDVAFPNADDDFQRIDQAPVFRAWREQTGHSGTYRDRDGVRGGGAFAPVAVDWLLWQLKGDRQAARRFVGPDCGLCTQPDWHVQKKGME